MAIFRPTKITGDVVIFSKWCVECENHLAFTMIRSWAQKNNLELQIIRTAYRPADHKEAMKLWAKACGLALDTEEGEALAAEYPVFVVHDGAIATVKEFVKVITKNKMVKEGVTKNDVSGLSEAEGTSRANSLARPASKTKAKNQKRNKGGK